MERREFLERLGFVAGGIALLPEPVLRALASELPQATLADKAYPAAINLNQVGYLPSARKVASIANAPTGGSPAFRVVSMPSASEVFSGTCSDAKLDEASGDTIALADLSEVAKPGTYRVEAAGMTSDPFTIAPDIYRRSLYLTARSFYGQRCGCEVDLGDGYKHPACHADGAYHSTSGKEGKAKHLGGWHDAGDYGRYVVNSGVSTATLIYAFDLFPQAVTALQLDIPPHHRHLPDLLAEARWNLDWMISLQDNDGGVWHKQTSEQFCAFIMPQADKLTSYIIGSGHAPYKTTAATADLAATAALASRVYHPFDRHYAHHCLKVARKAWQWAVEHPHEIFDNPPGIGTGGYGDKDLSDELMWASAELFHTTGEAQYEAQFLAGLIAHAAPLSMPPPGWGNLFSLACFAYTQSPHAKAEGQNLLRPAFAQAAARLIETAGSNGYGHTLTPAGYGWGSNSGCANDSVLLLLADRLEPNPAARAVALDNLHYLLGRNCHGVSWVTHLGARPFMHPHHRPSAADGIVAPWPGLLSGGPNRHPGDPAARTLPQMPPMRMWLDDERAYSMNEVAINWNAPLVFLLAAANMMA